MVHAACLATCAALLLLATVGESEYAKKSLFFMAKTILRIYAKKKLNDSVSLLSHCK